MPLQATSGAASYDAFGGGVAAVPNYIEDVFSTYLYTGTGASRSITNGIDLSTKGGLTWIKSRDFADNHNLFDTARGAGKYLVANATNAQATDNTRLSAFTTSGFSLGTNGAVNGGDFLYASWTFRKQPKFFDVVTFTSSSAGDTTFSHNLGVAAGCIILKNTQSADGWVVYHRSVGNNAFLRLNTTSAQDPLTGSFSVTSTSVTVNASLMIDNNSYVAYLFAHDAGGFGLTGTDNVISCGSYTGNGSDDGPTITLGYEPQWLLIKRSSSADNWTLVDTMRGFFNNGTDDDYYLNPNLSSAETAFRVGEPTATGFKLRSLGSNVNANGSNYIYIAIRRGPMKVPTSGTSVFTPLSYTNSTGGVTISSLTYPADLVITDRKNDSSHRAVWDRLRGATKAIYTNLTNAEGTVGDGLSSFASNVGYTTGSGGAADNTVDGSQINWVFKRAPSFFDVVCYTGTGSARTVSHNLGVAPELMIVRSRSAAANWEVYVAALGPTKYLRLDLTSAAGTYSDFWNDTAPTASVFTVATDADVNGSGRTQIAYLFATCAGVSKVGSYTGTGTTKQVDCGFTGGARFVLIKRTDSTGDWYVWDSARGIVAGNDPYLLLNSTAAEVTSTDYIDTYSAGFEISSTAPAAINASGGTFIFLAIA